MNKKIENFSYWYADWHKHPRHRQAHLVIFFSFLFLIISFLLVELVGLNVEISRAQTPCDSSRLLPDFPNVVIVCDFSPQSAEAGDTIQVSGSAMGTSVQLANVDGTVFDVNGITNGNGTFLVFVIPPATTPGNYSITVTSSDGITTGTIQGTLTVTELSSAPPSNTPPPPFTGINTPITIPPATDFQELITSAFNYAILFVGIAVFIVILWAGFLWLTSGANPGNISTAKRMISNAIFGAIILFAAYVILYTINPELVGGKFTLGGIKDSKSAANSQSVLRLVATSEMGAAGAITQGCVIATEIEDITAVDCPFDIAAATGLPFDPVLQTQDTGVNQQINAITVQNSGNLGSGRKIVILDTGYNYTHPELNSSYGGGRDFVNNDNDPMDDNTSGAGAPAHGSHVAGIITGDGIDPRARGVAPQAQIIAGKILNNKGEGNWSSMIEAIYWAVNGPDGIYGTADDFKADAINISVGGGAYTSICDNTDETTRHMARALQYARDNGVLPVIAAGNIAGGVSFPGCIDASFTVGAVNSSDNIAGFSGRGAGVDIVAPGVNIYSSLLGNAYGTKQGTSQATPAVSGVVALLKSVNPGYTVSQLEQALTSTACDLGVAGKDSTYGWGRVSAAPNSCAPAPTPPPPPGGNGRIWVSPSSCTKNSISSNPNCDITINYNISGLSAPTTLTLDKNGSDFPVIQCPTSTCNGQITDPNPRAGFYKFTLKRANNSQLGYSNSYIYTSGTISSNFSSCAKLAIPANLNCDITLTISTSGISPSPVVIKRDGINWRIVQCPTPACSQVTDLNPPVGIHTYTLHDSADNSRLDRATTTILGRGPPSNGSYFATLCSGVNYTGTCEQFYNSDMDLSNNVIGDNTALSMRGYATLCANTGLGGTCETFMADTPDLSSAFIGGATVSSLRRGLTGGPSVTFCTDINFGGICETLYGNDPDFSDNLVGNDSVSSIRVNTTDVTLCRDFNGNGICQDFREGVYPDLRYHSIDNDTLSSIKSL